MEDESENSDEIVELDLITSCTGSKVVPVQVPKQEPKYEPKSASIEQETLLGRDWVQLQSVYLITHL